MLAAGHRLRRRADFAAAVRGGRRVARGALAVHVTPGQVHPDVSSAPTRAGFIVSRAVGGAVTRNAVKRRLRHLVAERLPDVPAGTSLVVRALPAAAARRYPELAADLDAALAAALIAQPAATSRNATSRNRP